MPPFDWPGDPVQIIQAFEARHGNPASGALLWFAVWAVDSLYYLSDIDSTHDLSQSTIGGHRPDVVEVAHARWATGTCITALDLCAAGLGRALCAHTETRELDIAAFRPGRKSDPTDRLRSRLPPRARQWVDDVRGDSQYRQIKAVRDSLTHARVLRHFTVPRERLRLQVENDRLDVPDLIDCAKGVGARHVSMLLGILPDL